MAERRDADLVSDMREAASRILLYTDGLDYAAFLSDLRTQDAVVRNLEILGEAAKRLSPGFRGNHPDIAWSDMAGMRDRLIHQYFGVNWEIVWSVVREKLPDFVRHLDATRQDGRK